MKIVELFAGVGGFGLGFENAGHEIVAHVEKDANCLKLLAARWPNAVALDDVCTAGAHNLPECDVITFGFPCQDLSVAGKRAGLKGSRSGLFYEATRIINELKPAFCLFENVPGLLSSEQGRDFANVLLEMDRIGYNGAWRVLDAQWFGVAQRRRRVFGLFSRLDSGAERCAEVLSISESLRGHPAPSREAGEGVAGCLTGGATGGSSHGKKSGTDREGFLTVVKAVRTPTGGIDREDMHTLIPAVDGCLQERDAKGADSDTKPGHLIAVAQGWLPQRVRIHDVDGVSPTLVSEEGRGHGVPTVAVPGFVAHGIAVNSGQGFWRESDHAGTLGTEARAVHENNLVPVAISTKQQSQNISNGVANAIGANDYKEPQAVQLGMQVRRLTCEECEKLQGFPVNWTAGFSDSVRYKMLGNAVAVPVAEWIARRMEAQ